MLGMSSKTWRRTNTDFRGNKLEKGDILKIGRFVFRVNQIHTSGRKPDLSGIVTDFGEALKASYNFEEESLGNSIEAENLIYKSNILLRRKEQSMQYEQIKKQIVDDEFIWRICLSETESEEDPFVTPCNCSGTMKYIHLNWIKSWINSKKSIKDGEYYSSILWQTITWELCKQDFKDTVAYRGKLMSLMDFDVPQGNNWLILDALNTEHLFDQKVKLIHIFDFKELNTLSLGRGHSSDVKLSDISISRLHAYLKLIDSDIWIEDANSKFGCLYLQQKPFELNKTSDNLSIQIGRTHLAIRIENNKKLSGYMWWWRPYKKYFEGQHFEEWRHQFPEILQKIYDFNENMLKRVLQESILESNRFHKHQDFDDNDGLLINNTPEIILMNEKRFSNLSIDDPNKLNIEECDFNDAKDTFKFKALRNQKIVSTIEKWEEEVKRSRQSNSAKSGQSRWDSNKSNKSRLSELNMMNEEGNESVQLNPGNSIDPLFHDSFGSNFELYAKLREDQVEAWDFSDNEHN
jgi:hypothetical protein